MVDEMKSEIDSDGSVAEDNNDDEEYETITISEATNEQRYDDKLDILEEKKAMVRFKG